MTLFKKNKMSIEFTLPTTTVEIFEIHWIAYKYSVLNRLLFHRRTVVRYLFLLKRYNQRRDAMNVTFVFKPGVKRGTTSRGPTITIYHPNIPAWEEEESTTLQSPQWKKNKQRAKSVFTKSLWCSCRLCNIHRVQSNRRFGRIINV